MLDRFFEAWPEGLTVKRKELKLTEPFALFASRFAQDEGTVVLLSGGDLDSARYNMLATMPWLTLSGYGQAMTLAGGGRQEHFTADPFDAVREVSSRFAFGPDETWGPVASGLFGYLSYDLKDAVEKLPRTTLDRWQLPQLWFAAPRALVVEDRRTGEVSLWVTGGMRKRSNEPPGLSWHVSRGLCPPPAVTGETEKGSYPILTCPATWLPSSGSRSISGQAISIR